jgi:hypothetical protein
MANRTKSCFDATVTLSTVATVTIVPAVAGKFFVVTDAIFEITANAAASGSATVQINGNGVAEDIATAQIIADNSGTKPRAVGGLNVLTLGDGTGTRKRADLTNPIQAQVTSAAGGTLVSRCWIEGYYI